MSVERRLVTYASNRYEPVPYTHYSRRWPDLSTHGEGGVAWEETCGCSNGGGGGSGFAVRTPDMGSSVSKPSSCPLKREFHSDVAPPVSSETERERVVE